MSRTTRKRDLCSTVDLFCTNDLQSGRKERNVGQDVDFKLYPSGHDADGQQSCFTTITREFSSVSDLWHGNPFGTNEFVVGMATCVRGVSSAH